MKTFNKMRNEKGEMRNCFFSGAILVLSAFCFLLSSCSQDEVFEQDSLKDTPLTIASAGVAELTTRAIINGKVIVVLVASRQREGSDCHCKDLCLHIRMFLLLLFGLIISSM